jgi:selenide, water dikinase
VFGKIAANHALSDCHAMCVPAVSALAVVVVPFGLENKVTQSIIQMMAGACEILKESNCALVGGHTCEGKEMSLGFVINGVAEGSDSSSVPTRVLTKGGMKRKDVIVLTKAIGTGVLFAARMRNKTKGRWIKPALASMMQSSRVVWGEGVCTVHHTGCFKIISLKILLIKFTCIYCIEIIST